MDNISIKLESGAIKLDFTFEPTKADVVALFAFINQRMDTSDEDSNAQKLTGLSGRLKTSNDKLQNATGEK